MQQRRFCLVMERFRSIVFDAGTQGLGFDANHDEIPPPESSFHLLQAPASVRAVADVARGILNGDLVAMNEVFNANEGLPPRATLDCLHQGALVRALRHVSGTARNLPEVHSIQTLILSFLEPRDVVRATSDLPPGWGSYQIDDLLWYTRLLLTDSRFNVIDEKVWRKCFGDAALSVQRLSFREAPSPKSLNALREGVKSLNAFASIPVEGNVKPTLLTLPDRLRLNDLIALAAAPQPGHQPTGIDYIYSPIVTQYGDMPVRGGVVAISNGLLIGSRNQSVANQSALVESHGCQLPPLVAAVALLFVTRIESSSTATGPVDLLGRHPWSYTRCIEQIVELVLGFGSWKMRPAKFKSKNKNKMRMR